MSINLDELYFIVMLGGLAVAVLIAVPTGMALARILEWIIDRFD